jgi:hypothetical protein
MRIGRVKLLLPCAAAAASTALPDGIQLLALEAEQRDEQPEHCHTLRLEHPILTNRDLEKLRRVSQGDFLATTLPALFPAADGEHGLELALTNLCKRASLAIKSGYTLLIISDRGVDEEYAPIPSLLAISEGLTP